MYIPEPRKYLNPKPCEGAPDGFYECARYESRYGISKDGKIWSKKLNKILDTCFTESENPNKYKTVLGKDGIHRLLAETFLSTDHIPPWEKPVVNHIDGNKHNNVLDNIEWTTVKGNAQHAKLTGLLKNLCPVICKNYYTGEEIKFLSISDCSYELNTNPEELSEYLNKKDRTKELFLNKFIIIKEGERWPLIKKEPLDKEKDMDEGWLVLDREKGCAAIFYSASSASRYMGHTQRYIYDMYRKALTDGTHILNSDKYLCCPLRYHKEFIRDLSDIKSYIKPTVGKNNRRVRVKDLETGKFRFYNSLKDFAKEIGSTETALAVYLRKHKNKYKKKFKVKFFKPISKKLYDFVTTPLEVSSKRVISNN